MAKQPKTITEVIQRTEVAFINKLTEDECNDIAHEVAKYLKGKAESVESLFDPDKDQDEQIMAIPLKSIILA